MTSDRLKFRAYTAAGDLYDAFELTRQADGFNRLTEEVGVLPDPRLCRDGAGPDGGACIGSPK